MYLGRSRTQLQGFLLGCVAFCAVALVTVRAVQVTLGGAVTLSVTVEGTAPFSYQWLKDGNKIADATSVTYAVRSAQTSDSGVYSVTVTNGVGSTISPGESINVEPAPTTAPAPTPPPAAAPDLAPTPTPAPTVTSSPSNNGPSSIAAMSQTATAGHDVTFSAATNTTGQWQISTDSGATWSNLNNDGRYAGVTTGTLSVFGVDSGVNAAQYRFVSQGVTGALFSLFVAPVLFPFPLGIAADQSGNLYVADTSTDTVQKISNSGIVTLVAGSKGQTGTVDGNGSNARFNDPSGVSAAPDGTLYVSDGSNGVIRRILADGTVSTLAGSTSNRGNTDGTGSAATFSSPLGICRDGTGNLYLADALNNTVRKITSGGVVSTIAGAAGVAGNTDGNGGAARFNHPTGVAVDGAGNVYVSDAMNNTVRKITSAGVVTTIAGLAGVSGGQDGIGFSALFNNPGGLAVDSSGNVYVADTGNSTIRRISSDGRVSTLAGLPGIAGLMDGIGSNAWFNQPKGLVLDQTGTLYVADTGNAAIRRVTLTGIVSTLTLAAGTNMASSPAPDPTPTVAATPASVPSTSNASTASQSTSGGGGGGGTTGGAFVAACGLLFVLKISRPFRTRHFLRA